MSAAIELRNVTKNYGTARGVQNVSLQVATGSVLGFLGPNGSGKTTTISMLINLTRPTSGTITIFGKDSIKYGLENRAKIGHLAGDMALDKALTGRQQLEYFGNLRGAYNPAYVAELAKRLDTDLGRRIKSLSRGNRQKIGLIAALMHQPDVLILDEPTSGLDPLIQAEFNKIILEHKQAGKTTLISSHVLSEVQELCDRVVIIREGKIIANKTLDELTQGNAKQIRLTVTERSAIPYVTALKGVEHLHVQGGSARFTYKGDINDLLHQLSKKPLNNITIQDTDLEHIFMKYYEGTSDV